MLLDETVSLQLKLGKIRRISTLDDAADVLLYKWPGPQETAKHLAARRAVYKAMQSAQSQADTAKARKALQEAAKEAGILAVNRW